MNGLWASAHEPIEGQLNAFQRVDRLEDYNRELFMKLKNSPDNNADLVLLAKWLLDTASFNRFDVVLQPAGSLAFQHVLGVVSHGYDVKVGYAHSQRVATDVVLDDGSVQKTSIFKHIKWIVL